MRSWIYSRLLRMAVGFVAAAFILVPPVMAQNSQAVTDFLANPSQALQQYPNGGAQFISLIRDAALADHSALSNIIALLANANTDQASAIGSGLGQAANASVRTDQAYANEIQRLLALAGNLSANTAYAAVTGNTMIGSAGGAGVGGGGGPGGGQTGTGGIVFGGPNSGNVQTFGGLHYQTSSQNWFTGGGVGGTTSSTTVSVSPH